LGDVFLQQLALLLPRLALLGAGLLVGGRLVLLALVLPLQPRLAQLAGLEARLRPGDLGLVQQREEQKEDRQERPEGQDVGRQGVRRDQRREHLGAGGAGLGGGGAAAGRRDDGAGARPVLDHEGRGGRRRRRGRRGRLAQADAGR